MDPLAGTNAVAVASVHLPRSAFSPSSALQSVDNSSCKLQFIAFRNGKLFPSTGNSSHLADYGTYRTIGTPVIFIKIDGCSIGNLTSPLIITLKHFAQGINPIAVFWDFDLLDGHGGWWGEGCHIINSADNITTLHSTHFGNFAVLMPAFTYLQLPVESCINSGAWMDPWKCFGMMCSIDFDGSLVSGE
ncbi:UNVERIFIED_CONTAM: hypothetical protein K2H54_035358 [Gekko kuhli]